MAVKTYKAEVFDSNKYRLGEGPFYTKSLNRLSWIDILDGRIYTLINGKKEYVEMGQHIGAAIPAWQRPQSVLSYYFTMR